MSSTTVVYGYTRASLTDPPGTVERHQAAMREYARLRLPGLPYRGDFIDQADARRLPLTSRPRGLRLSLEAGRNDHILVARFGRAFPNLDDLTDTLHIWSARGVHLHVLDIGLDPTTAVGKFVAVACQVLVRARQALAKEQGAADFARRRIGGMALNGNAPPCYRYVGPRGKRRLIQDAYARQLAARVIEWKHRGFTWEQVYWHLQRHGVQQRTGREFSVTAFRRLYDAERSLQAQETADRAQAEEQVGAEPAAAPVPS